MTIKLFSNGNVTYMWYLILWQFHCAEFVYTVSVSEILTISINKAKSRLSLSQISYTITKAFYLLPSF